MLDRGAGWECRVWSLQQYWQGHRRLQWELIMGSGSRCWQLGSSLLRGLRCPWLGSRWRSNHHHRLLEGEVRGLGWISCKYSNWCLSAGQQQHWSSKAAFSPTQCPRRLCIYLHHARLAAASTMWPQGVSFFPKFSVSFALNHIITAFHPDPTR